MIIATWNVERLKHKRQLGEIVAACADTHADILVLTETDTRVSIPYPYCFNSAPLCEDEGDYYSTTERRISIFTHYECVRRHQPFDEKTALCVELKTEKGNLLVYGTIIGIHGNRRSSFKHDLDCQLEDYYYTKESRQKLLAAFSEHGIALATKDQVECIDHIAVSSSFLGNSIPMVTEWNLDKSLSDHKGIAVSFS